MKVAILCESNVDEVALRKLVEGLLGRKTERVYDSALLTLPWPSPLTFLPKVLDALNARPDVDGLVVVVDSDKSPCHQPDHGWSNAATHGCRLCMLRQAIDEWRGHRKGSSRSRELLTAVGIAVPEIEAWYRFAFDSRITEAAWANGQKAGAYPYTKEGLKQSVYGTSRPAWEVAQRSAEEAADRLVCDLSALTTYFPIGFGSLVQCLLEWLREGE